MTRSLLRAALVVLAAPAAFAQTVPPPGSLNTWVEACEAEETAADLQALLAHEMAIVPVESIVQNLNGTFSVVHEPFVEIIGGDDLCPNAPFYGDTRVQQFPFRSAVQVGEDLVLTAWHGAFAPSHGLEDYVVVAGLRSRMVGDQCQAAAFDGLDGSQLFTLTAVVADGEPTPTGGGIDFLLLRVDRPISATYPRVRRSGRGYPGDSVTSIGHPERLAARVDVAGTAGRVGPFLPFPWEALEVANVHLLWGSSGGMLYNRTQRFVETVARQSGNADYTPAGQSEPDCWTILHQDRWSSINASLRHFAANIPAFELIVDDLDPVVNVTTGGSIPNPASSRTVSAPATAAGPIAYEIVPPPPFTSGEPTLLITPGGPLSGTLAPGTGFTIQEQAHIHGSDCGRFEKSYVVRDLTNGFEDVARHQFEIRLREFTVVPESTPKYRDIALPLEEKVVYTVANPREETVTVVVSVDQPWALVRQKGGPGPASSIEVTLEGGASAEVVLDVVGPLEPETFPHTYTATLSFDFEDGTPCPAFTEPVTRPFQLTLGQETFSGPAPFTIPDAPGGPLQVSLPITEPFCIGDVNVFIHTIHVPAYHIDAKIKGPLHGQIKLWNHTVLQGDRPLKGLFDDEGNGAEGTLPLHESLNPLEGHPGNVTWQLELHDITAGEQGSLDSWKLEFTAANCPN